MMDNQQQLKEITFGDKIYSTEDLTPRVINAFNVIFKLQAELNTLSYNLTVKQAAQAKLSSDLELLIKEDKIKPREKEQVQEAEVVEKETK